jgi:K+-transporting ATPase A subunit
MHTNNIHRHCPEVENLMDGKMPFVTRCGITLVLLVLLVIAAILLLSDGTPQQLMKEMILHTIEQITSKYK